MQLLLWWLLPRRLEFFVLVLVVEGFLFAIWEMYGGWFHHQSTTELYSTPARTVYPELVELAGGPDPIAAAAQHKSASAPLEAIHLAEVALVAVPQHRGALAASLAAHQTLLLAARNFWEVRWLEHRIRQLEAALREAP